VSAGSKSIFAAMKRPLLALFFYISALTSFSQEDSSVITLSKVTLLSEVVIRNDLDVVHFLQRVKDDSSFYKAFRNLRILGFTSMNDIRMKDKKGRVEASLFSKTRQTRSNDCRTMEVLEEKITGNMYDKESLDYYTAELYASLFFTSGTVCNENNIVSGTARNVRSKSGVEKHKEQLKMLFFNPGKKIPGIPFIGDKIDIFNPDISRLYNFAVDMEDMNGEDCYVFRITPKDDLKRSERNKIVFDNITTWFNSKTMEIVARNYDLSFNTPAYDFNVHMEVEMTKFNGMLVPRLLRYDGDWKVVLKKRERGIFTATIFDFTN
jgi:hypothetical protein